MIVNYGYDAAGRLERKTVGNGVYTRYEHDGTGRVVKLANHEPDDSLLSSYDYTYDASGHLTPMATVQRDGSGRSSFHLYEYDPLGQLTRVTYHYGELPEVVSIVKYEYDAAGNRLAVTHWGTSESTEVYVANELNQYTETGDATYTYDNDGNVTLRRLRAASRPSMSATTLRTG